VNAMDVKKERFGMPSVQKAVWAAIFSESVNG
jgi:hypothetical protein